MDRIAMTHAPSASLLHDVAPDVIIRRRQPLSIVVVILAIILLVVILPPSIFLAKVSFFTTRADGSFGELTLQYYKSLVASRFFYTALMNTLIYAVGSAAVALVLGTLQAVIVERTNTPGRQWAFLGAIISLGIPNVLYTVAWLLILGRAGPVNATLISVLGEGGAINVYSMWGMILIEGVHFVPLTFLLMSAVLRSSDASFEEASMMSGARPVRTFLSVTLRMGLPGVMALLLLIFIRAFESFEVPALVGLAGNIDMMTTNIYQSSKSSGVPNYGEAGAYSMCLLLIVSGLLFAHNRISRHAHQFQTITGKGYRPRVINLGRSRYFAAILQFTVLFLVTGLPLLMLIFTSLQPFYEGVSMEALSRVTLENYTVLLGPGSFRDSIVNTLVLGFSTASIVVPFTAICAWLVARRKTGAWILDQLATVPLVFPAIVMSVAFLYVFVNFPLPIYGTLLSVIIASSVRYLPYGMRYAYAGVLQIHRELEDASMSAGARQGATFWRISLPLLATSLVSAWLFVFLLSVQAVSLPLLLVGPGTEIVAVTLFDLWQNGQVNELAAMGIMWVSLMIFVCTAFYLVTRRYQMIAA